VALFWKNIFTHFFAHFSSQWLFNKSVFIESPQIRDGEIEKEKEREQEEQDFK